MSKFTDYLGNPINEGDTIVYPVCSGSSSAYFEKAVIKDLIPLVPKPGAWIPTGPLSRVPLVRADQEFKDGATEYSPVQEAYDRASRAYKPQPEKQYVLRVQERRDDGTVKTKTKFIKNVDRVLVVTDLI